MYAHQDWSTVVLNKTSDKQPKAPPIQKQPKYIAQLQNDEPPKYFDKPYIDQVVKSRIERKLTQKQLATTMNEDVNRINRFEQGKEVYDHKLKVKLNRYLNISNK